jgi:hypothetical protein
MTEERWKVPGFQGIGEHRFKITPTLKFTSGVITISERSTIRVKSHRT